MGHSHHQESSPLHQWLLVQDGPIDEEIVRQWMFDPKNLELAPLKTALKAFLVEFRLGTRNTQLLIAVVGDPLLVMFLGQLRKIMLKGGPGFITQVDSPAAFSLLVLSAGRPIDLPDFIPFALARPVPGSPRCPDLQPP